MSLSVTQIVPRLPPPIDGVGDYALELAVQLRRFGIGLFCAVQGKRGAAVARCGNEFTVRPTDVARPPRWPRRVVLPEPAPSSSLPPVTATPGERAVVVGRSSPASQERARTSCPACRPPRTLLRGSGVPLLILDGYITTTRVYFDELKRWRPDVSVAHMLPVPSNVGELETPTPLADRAPVAMLFGQEGARGRRWRRPLRSRSPRALATPYHCLCVKEIFR